MAILLPSVCTSFAFNPLVPYLEIYQDAMQKNKIFSNNHKNIKRFSNIDDREVYIEEKNPEGFIGSAYSSYYTRLPDQTVEITFTKDILIKGDVLFSFSTQNTFGQSVFLIFSLLEPLWAYLAEY